MAQKHTYHTGSHSGKILHVLSTPASNIRLYNLGGRSCLRNSAYYGINGGWFSNRALNLALNDGKIIGPGTMEGAANNWCGDAISWNGSNLKAYTPIQDMASLDADVCNGTPGTWAQGGFSMFLGNSN